MIWAIYNMINICIRKLFINLKKWDVLHYFHEKNKNLKVAKIFRL